MTTMWTSWSWSYGSWIYNYQHYSCEFESRSWRGVLNTTLCDKVCQWLAAGRWFSQGSPFSFTNKTDRHNITETLLKVALNTLTLYLTILECCVKVNFKSQKRKTILEDLGKFILILTCLLIGRRLNMPNDSKMM